MNFEGDADKAERNLSKHGVSFEGAELVFYDSRRIEVYDDREDWAANIFLRKCQSRDTAARD